MPTQSLIVLLLSGTLSAPAAFAQEREQPGGEPLDPGTKLEERADRQADQLENRADKVRAQAESKADRLETQGKEEQAEKVRTQAEQKADKLEREADRVRERADERTETPSGDESVVPASAERAAAEAEQELSDTWITTKVKTALVTAEGLDNSDISVDTNRDGVVTLTGKVPSTAARERAASTAKRIEGVTKVNNMLKVVPAGKAE